MRGSSVTVQPIRLFGDPVLRTPAAEVVDFDKELATLVKDLWDTMESQSGAGLAAPQLGVGLRVFTDHCDGAAGHLVNPTWTALGEEYQDGEEGCLSIPGQYWDCRRHLSVVARCIQHETDHLDGVLFLDRLDAETRKAAMKAIREADWFDGGLPVIKENPHPLFGKAI